MFVTLAQQTNVLAPFNLLPTSGLVDVVNVGSAAVTYNENDCSCEWWRRLSWCGTCRTILKLASYHLPFSVVLSHQYSAPQGAYRNAGRDCKTVHATTV